MKLLLKRKANTVIRNTYGTSTLHFAARRGNFDVCRMLLDVPEVDINAKDNADVSARFFCILLLPVILDRWYNMVLYGQMCVCVYVCVCVWILKAI